MRPIPLPQTQRGGTVTKKTLTQDILKELLHYDPGTGIFTWRKRDFKWFRYPRSCHDWNYKRANSAAGCITKTGYMKIVILGVSYRSHRMIFLYMTGYLPPYQIDHINGIRHDNRWCNLRSATPLENSRNQRMREGSASGVTGVSWYENLNKWVAKIKVKRKNIHLGYFVNIGDAAEARKAAEIKYDFHQNHGRQRITAHPPF